MSLGRERMAQTERALVLKLANDHILNELRFGIKA